MSGPGGGGDGACEVCRVRPSPALSSDSTPLHAIPPPSAHAAQSKRHLFRTRYWYVQVAPGGTASPSATGAPPPLSVALTCGGGGHAMQVAVHREERCSAAWPAKRLPHTRATEEAHQLQPAVQHQVGGPGQLVAEDDGQHLAHLRLLASSRSVASGIREAVYGVWRGAAAAGAALPGLPRTGPPSPPPPLPCLERGAQQALVLRRRQFGGERVVGEAHVPGLDVAAADGGVALAHKHERVLAAHAFTGGVGECRRQVLWRQLQAACGGRCGGSCEYWQRHAAGAATAAAAAASSIQPAGARQALGRRRRPHPKGACAHSSRPSGA